jgi:hypothetical protein
VSATGLTLEPSESAGPPQGAFGSTRRVFFAGLFVTTLIPLLLMPVLARVHPGSTGISTIRNLLVFLGGNAHVGLTAFFYTDRDLRGFFREHRGRYLWAPLVLILSTGLVYQFVGEPWTPHILVAYFVWQTYHYMRQNYGLLAFVAAATGTGRPSWLERATLNLGVAAGILGLVRLMSLYPGTLLEGQEHRLYAAGLITHAFVPAAFVAALVSNPRIRSSPLRLTFFVLCSCFYLPTFLFDDLASAVLSYALAHGLQYFVFMYYVGYRGGVGSPTARVLVLALLGFSVGWLLTAMSTREAWGSIGDFVFGCYLGMVMSHFVVDAGLWRLRERFQREYLLRSFGFVFANHATGQRIEPPAS